MTPNMERNIRKSYIATVNLHTKLQQFFPAVFSGCSLVNYLWNKDLMYCAWAYELVYNTLIILEK